MQTHRQEIKARSIYDSKCVLLFFFNNKRPTMTSPPKKHSAARRVASWAGSNLKKRHVTVALRLTSTPTEPSVRETMENRRSSEPNEEQKPGVGTNSSLLGDVGDSSPPSLQRDANFREIIMESMTELNHLYECVFHQTPKQRQQETPQKSV